MDQQMNLLASETSEMVPDEFLSWLMSDLDGKDAGLSPGPQQQQQQQQQQPQVKMEGMNEQSAYFHMYEGASSSSGGSSSSSSSGAANRLPMSGLGGNYSNEFVPHAQGQGQGVYPLPQAFPTAEQRMGSHASVVRGGEGGEEDDDNGEESDQDHEQDESNSKVGEKRKVPRSREIAKECRRRQRERKEELESRVATLKKENEELREHFQNVSQRTTDIQRQRAGMETLMQGHLKDIEKLPEDSEERKHLVKLVLKFTDLYADYGSCRQKEIAFHLAQLEKLILPTQITKMILWTLQQDYKFFEEKSSPIWGILVKELDMTPDQISFLAKQRSEVLQLLLHLKESLSLIKELKVSIKDKHETFDRECGKITTEASANQTVRFILWITNNADKLAKVIPDFERIVPHVSHAPNVSMP
jgi:hypothetical protein